MILKIHTTKTEKKEKEKYVGFPRPVGNFVAPGKNPFEIVIRSHYVTMVDNNRGRFFLAVEPAYADVEYVFFISSRWYYMLLLSCRLHNCRPHRLDCGGCARVYATSSS
jgi:hypothetical protein